jgi:hypothetical protein
MADPTAEERQYPYQAWLSVNQMVPNEANPNVMSDQEFNALCASIEEDGWTQLPSVVSRGDADEGVSDGKAVVYTGGTYDIVGGEHRWRAARVLGHTLMPVTVLDPEKYHRDRQNWQMVKQNIVHGKLNPEKFARLYEDMADRYEADVLRSLMGFTSQEAFQKVYKETRAALPPELQKALDAAKDEIKTIDDLSVVLNRLFREFGETLPSNMMVFSWAGKQVLWIRCDDKLWKIVSSMAKKVADESGDMGQEMLNALLSSPLSRNDSKASR